MVKIQSVMGQIQKMILCGLLIIICLYLLHFPMQSERGMR